MNDRKMRIGSAAATLATTFAVSLVAAPAGATGNPFAAVELERGYMVAGEHGEGACGAGSKSGEAACGGAGDAAKSGEGACGGDETDAATAGEGSSGAKGGEGACGAEGKCGS